MFFHPLTDVVPNSNPSVVIDSFQNEYRFLSNFWIGTPIEVETNVVANGMVIMRKGVYATGEHAYQAQKAQEDESFRYIMGLDSPSKAKRAGASCALTSDWESRKFWVMKAVQTLKFAPERVEAKMLLETGDAYLCEGNKWGDRTWGVGFDRNDVTKSPSGANWLGTILMEQRAWLRLQELPESYQNTLF